MKAGPDRAANLSAAARAVHEARRAGAELVVLPEMFSWRGPPAEEANRAESIPGPTSRWACELSAREGVYLVAGSMLEKSSDPRRCFNTSILTGPGGNTMAVYRKIHLFDVDLPGRVTIRESRSRCAGDRVVCADTPLGRIGLAICYDLRFPELFRSLADHGAEIVAVPSAFTAPTGKAHWETLLRARAVENQCYLAAADQFGPTEYGFADYGHSMLVDPWGEVLAQAGNDHATVVTARFEAKRLDRVRSELPALQHRREFS